MSLQTRLSALISAIGADVKSLQSQVNALKGGAWGNPILSNSWVSYGPADPPKYRVVGSWLELNGAIKNGTRVSNQLVLTIPGVQLAQQVRGVVFDGQAGASQVTLAGGFIASNSGTDVAITQNLAWASGTQIILSGIRIPMT
jgi:hypothetical protein